MDQMDTLSLGGHICRLLNLWYLEREGMDGAVTYGKGEIIRRY